MPRGRAPVNRRRSRAVSPVRGGPSLKIPYPRMVRQPMSVWQHLKKIVVASPEDAILLYEITNTATCSNYIRLPEDPDDLAVLKKMIECYANTKRYAQAGAILTTIINTFPNQRPFSYPSFMTPVAEEDKIVLTDEELDEKDSIWYSYYDVLRKAHKFKEAHDALMNVRSSKYCEKRDEALPELIRHIKNPKLVDDIIPDPWSPKITDKHDESTTSSSLYPAMTRLKEGDGSASDVAKKFSNQFTGKAKTDVYWWLKSTEAAAENKTYEAISCLQKMTHQNPRVLTEMAKLNLSIDKRDEARRLLKTAHAKDPLWIDNMDLLVFLCIGDFEKNGSLIQEVAEQLSREWPHRVETFIVNGFLAHQFDLERADAFATRALRFVLPQTPQFVYVVHLKVYCTKAYKAKCTSDAARADYRDDIMDLLVRGVDNAPNSADLALLYVDSLMENENGHRDAKYFATKFLHDNPNLVHAKLLKVHVLVNVISRNSETNHPPIQELITLLNGLIDEHPHLLAAFCFLLNEYTRLGDNKKCREVFDKLTASRHHFPPSRVSKVHRVSADFLLKAREVIPAYQHLMAAIATGAVVDSTVIAKYEKELASNQSVGGEYKNLAFIDALIQRLDEQR